MRNDVKHQTRCRAPNPYKVPLGQGREHLESVSCISNVPVELLIDGQGLLANSIEDCSKTWPSATARVLYFATAKQNKTDRSESLTRTQCVRHYIIRSLGAVRYLPSKLYIDSYYLA